MKNNKTNDNNFSIIILLAGIVATAMLFFPAMAFPDSDTTFLGYEIVFGTEFANLGGFVTGQVLWSILGILAFFLPLAAGLIYVYVKKSAFLSGLLFIAGAVLLVLIPEYTKTTVTVLNITNEIDVSWVLSYGVMIAVVCSLIGVFATMIKSVSMSKSTA